MTELPTPHPQALLTELEDQTGVVLHLDTKFYYTLNPTGVFVWKALAGRRPDTVLELARRVTEVFDVDVERAETDVRALLDELRVEGLVVRG
jgi:hypothetical protein